MIKAVDAVSSFLKTVRYYVPFGKISLPGPFGSEFEKPPMYTAPLGYVKLPYFIYPYYAVPLNKQPLLNSSLVFPCAFPDSNSPSIIR